MPIDASIFQNLLRPPKSIADYDAEAQASQANALNVQLGRQKVQRGQFEADQAQRAQAEQAALRQLVSGFGADRKANYQTLVGAGQLGAAQQYEEQNAKTAGLESQAAVNAQTVKKSEHDINIAKTGQHLQGLAMVNDPAAYVRWIDDGVKSGLMTPEQADRGREAAWKAQQGGPQAFAQLREQTMQGGTSVLEQLKAKTDQQKWLEQVRQFGVTSGETQRHNKVSEGISGGNLAVAQQRLADDKAKPAGAAARGPMSVTLQKELLESDDTGQAAKNVVATLEEAAKINDKAYSGYGAKVRAELVSNLGGTKSADATVDMDNMMTGQALESLKLVFGGMPTEGERKILLDMQASVGKTPAQRKAIIDRAISAAKRREGFAIAKAKAIRDGSYLTDGVPTAPAPTAPPPATPPGKPAGKPTVSNW